MSDLQTKPTLIKTALFVDFDNIYLGLDKIDPAAADSFATYPARWLSWIEQGMPDWEMSSQNLLPQRSMLIRRCYLNPMSFSNFRAYFTRSAFSVIDCPPITQRGKNSSDIHMVMDILDTLQHDTHFDEYIIFSGDSDFTPVLLRLRAHDRRTVILTIGPVAQAYKAASDVVISSDVFIEDGLGIASEPIAFPAGVTASPALISYDHVLDAMAKKVFEKVSSNGEVAATNLSQIFKGFSEFKTGSNWLGFSSLRNLTLELTRRMPDLSIIEGDPWKVMLNTASAAQLVVQQPELDDKMEKASPATPVLPNSELKDAIVNRVKQFVSHSSEPVDMARAAWDVINGLGAQVTETEWAGAGSFKNLLQSVPALGLTILTSPNQPGYIYDPERHEPPPTTYDFTTAAPGEDKFYELDPKLSDFTRRIYQVTGTPRLTPNEYAVVFKSIEEELQQSAFSLSYTSKMVRDRCIEQGVSVPRQRIWFILMGIIYTGYRFGKNSEGDTAIALAEAFKDDVVMLCRNAQLELSDEEAQLLDDWICGVLKQGEQVVNNPSSANE